MIKMSYKTYGGNCPGMGSGHMSGAPGSYISNQGKRSPKGGTKKGKSMKNHPGRGEGHDSNMPAGGKSGIMAGSSGMHMGERD